MTPAPEVERIIERLRPGSRVTDVGCYGWTLSAACLKGGYLYTGLDRVEPPGKPLTAAFATMAGHVLHVADDGAELTVASHVLEHLPDPIAFFGELARITAPGGLLWLEAPSELSAAGRSSDDPEDHAFLSFWDDPTHVRPWTPGALYRLALSWRCRPLQCGRATSGDIPVSRLLAQKPADQPGRPRNAFVSLNGVPPGVDAAWRHLWG
jgi:SAM-dependent methyltransferase